MNLKDFIAVGGLPGLYKLVATRNNGLLIQEMDSDKTRFASSRKYQFTPLESVAIYTDDDSTELAEIFKRMKANLSELPLPESNASKAEYFDYFSGIVPDYDEERVMISDVKKVIKWYKYLSERDLLNAETEEAGEEEKSEETESAAKPNTTKKEKAKNPSKSAGDQKKNKE